MSDSSYERGAMLARRLVIGLLVLVLAACSGPPGPRTDAASARRVLFVGNSLVYVGNLPAVYCALLAAQGHAASCDMIVAGGATLASHLERTAVADALANGDYDAVVLQERGGDLMCAPADQRCMQSRHALARLAAMAGARGARVVLLGTYQPHPIASQRLVAGESAAAAAVSIPYVEISETWQRLRAQSPDLEWLDADGGHPGAALTLLDALRLHEVLEGRLPRAQTLAVEAPDFGPSAGLLPTLRRADAPPPRPATPVGIGYERQAVADMLRRLAGP
jgi:hypothetical protein